MKRISIVMVLAFVLASVASYAANPFSDVPVTHWAYRAVNELASKKLIEGYGDDTFRGGNHVTRYTLATILARMLQHIEQLNDKALGEKYVTKADLQTLEKLTVEFADELALLGVKVTALEDDMQVVKEDVSTLKKDVEGIKDYMAKGGMEKVKLSGDMLVRHSSLIHNRDYANNGFGNANNSQTESMIRFQFKANIDENITAVARWRMLNKVNLTTGNNTVNNTRWGYNGAGVHGADASADIDVAYLHIKDMFRFGGDFTFGRNFYSTGHQLVLNDYVDAIKYYKRTGDVDAAFYSIYDSHRGSWKDDGNVNYKNIWGLTLGTKYRDHDLYANFWYQADPNLAGSFRGVVPAKRATVGNGLNAMTSASTTTGWTVATAPLLKSDSLFEFEFGGKGPLGKNGHWDYDFGMVYSGYTTSLLKINGQTNLDMQGWAGTFGVKWDSKKEWAAKLGYTFATDEFAGPFALDNDKRFEDGIETPYEDIARGNNYFDAGMLNMYDLKVQAEYRPRNTKHYFRLAGDFLDEVKDTVANKGAKYAVGNYANAAIPTKINNTYDTWNNFGVADAKAAVLTFEYRYQLAENTKIRIGYTAFDFTGDFVKGTTTTKQIKAGRGFGSGDYDYNYAWAELYSRF